MSMVYMCCTMALVASVTIVQVASHSLIGQEVCVNM